MNKNFKTIAGILALILIIPLGSWQLNNFQVRRVAKALVAYQHNASAHHFELSSVKLPEFLATLGKVRSSSATALDASIDYNISNDGAPLVRTFHVVRDTPTSGHWTLYQIDKPADSEGTKEYSNKEMLSIDE